MGDAGRMIYTSYFGNWRKWTDLGIPISIARSKPKGFNGLSYKKLCPSADLLNRWKTGLVSEEDYIKEFKAYLSTLNKDEIMKELIALAPGYDIILLCYERANDFCHRHIVAEWLGDSVREV